MQKIKFSLSRISFVSCIRSLFLAAVVGIPIVTDKNAFKQLTKHHNNRKHHLGCKDVPPPRLNQQRHMERHDLISEPEEDAVFHPTVF
jgi:hypothetical protein